MRILSISNIFPPGFIGGYELGAMDVLRGLARRGHIIELLTSDYFVDDSGADEDAEAAFRVRRTLDCIGIDRSAAEAALRNPLGHFVLPRNLREVAGRLAVFRPDAVLCFNLAGLGPPGLLRLLTASGMRPVVHLMDNVFHGMSVVPEHRRAFDRIFGHEDWPNQSRFIFMSQRLRQETEATLEFSIDHATIVPGWFDPASIKPSALPRCDSETRFIYASRLAGHKGIDIALEACRDLVTNGFSRFTVDVYGSGEVARTLQSVAALGLRNQVRYMGAPAKSELQTYYGHYDALLFPTAEREPFGFVVAEAAAAGCIPVMTAGIGAAEWFLDGVDCLKITHTLAGVAAGMMRLISMSPEARAAMRGRAQSTAKRFFRFDVPLDSIEGVLREAAEAPVHAPRAAEAALSILTELWRSRPDG